MLNFETIIKWLTYIFSSTGAIFLLESIELKIEKSDINFLKKYESMVMNMMILLVFIFVIVTIPNTFQGADSTFLYIQYR